MSATSDPAAGKAGAAAASGERRLWWHTPRSSRRALAQCPCCMVAASLRRPQRLLRFGGGRSTRSIRAGADALRLKSLAVFRRRDAVWHRLADGGGRWWRWWLWWRIAPEAARWRERVASRCQTAMPAAGGRERAWAGWEGMGVGRTGLCGSVVAPGLSQCVKCL